MEGKRGVTVWAVDSIAHSEAGDSSPPLHIQRTDISGARVYSYQLGGEVSHLWTANNDSGSPVASGVYLWLLESDSKPPASGKIAMIR